MTSADRVPSISQLFEIDIKEPSEVRAAEEINVDDSVTEDRHRKEIQTEMQGTILHYKKNVKWTLSI